MRPLTGFQYKGARTLEEAWEAAARYPGEARYLAGGTDLLVQLKKGNLRTPLLISLKRVRHLSGVTVVGDWVHIGSLTPVEDLARSEVLKRRSPLLPLAAAQLGSRQIRNMATLGGNLCNASPAGDLDGAPVPGDGTEGGGPQGSPLGKTARLLQRARRNVALAWGSDDRDSDSVRGKRLGLELPEAGRAKGHGNRHRQRGAGPET